MAVCATPTTMMATLAAISSVFSSFMIFWLRVSGSSLSSSNDIGAGMGAGIACGIGPGAAPDIDPDMGPGIDPGIGGSEGGGAGVGVTDCGSAGVAFAAFLNGHFHLLGAPCGFGTFTGVSR